MMHRRCWCCQANKEKLVTICRDCTGGTVIYRYQKLLEFVKKLSYSEDNAETLHPLFCADPLVVEAKKLLKEIGE